MRSRIALVVLLALTGCAGHAPKPVSRAPVHSTTTSTTSVPPRTRPGKPPAFVPRGPYTAGGLYAPDVADSAPEVPEDISALPEPVPKNEPLSHYGNRTPYTVLGETYNVLPTAKGYVERGIASWYGTKFHGRATSNFEAYDMYQFTGAHKTLPLPSYVRVTNLDNGRSVIVRINDRGPFHEDRLIDLSYAAAVKLGVNIHGTAPVEVRAIDPDTMDAGRPTDAVVSTQPAGSVATTATHADASIVLQPVPASSPAANAATAQTGYLQVGSFGERGNAERLLDRLRDAGIDGAALREADVEGHGLWRVVIAGLDAAAAARIADRIVALGLGHPAFFRE
jgi:rare lipoprotein A